MTPLSTNTMQSASSPSGFSAPLPGEANIWQSLVQAKTAQQLFDAWLAVLCSMIPEIRAGLLLIQDTDGSFAPVSIWPDNAPLGHLVQIAEESLVTQEGIVRTESGQTPRFAYPLVSAGQLYGTVVVECQQASEAALTEAMRLTHWGTGWLVEMFARNQLNEHQHRLDDSAFLFDIVLAELGDTNYRQASIAVVNKLAEHFACHQVQLGLEKGKSIDIVAVSHSAWFEKKSKRVMMAAQAMEEAFDQRALVVWPEAASGALLVTENHRRYLNETGSMAACSLPLEAGAEIVGVVMLERDTLFTPSELAFLETVALALAPVLALKKEHQESVWSHVHRAWRHQLSRITDASHPGLKLLASVSGLLLLLAAIIPANFRVSAPAIVEGSLLRSIVAPFEGYVREAPARAGDVTKKGGLLVKLEDKDLVLEKSRWESELQLALRKTREAMSKADRVSQRLSAAQAGQARAELDLVLERLGRVSATSPFDAVVVKGDLSQKIGSPVKQGDVLLEIAPLDAWRVIVKVDEKDIAYVQEGQTGRLVLTSAPNQVFPFHVNKITPVSVADEGRNYFRVEAKLDENQLALMPNMEGIAKINVADKPLLWIATHRLLDWARLAWWEWMP